MTTTESLTSLLARQVFYGFLGDAPYRPTPRELRSDYKIRESQFADVKKKVKEIAAEYGAVWGYDSDDLVYKIAREGNHEEAERILASSNRHLRNEGEGYQWQVKGARKAGLITEHSAEEATKAVEQSRDLIAKANQAIVWTKAT